MRLFFGTFIIIVLMFGALWPHPADALSCGSHQANGRIVCLATNTSASANQSFTTVSLGIPKAVTVCIASTYPTTFLISGSLDGANFFRERFVNPNFSDPSQLASISVGTPGQCVAVIPAEFIRVTVPLAATVTIHVLASD